MIYVLAMVLNGQLYILDHDLTKEDCIAEARVLRANGLDNPAIDLFCGIEESGK